MLLVLLSVFCILFMKYECRAASLTSTGRSSIHNPQKRQPGATADKSISKSFKLNVVSWNMAEKIPDENDCEFIKGYRNSDVVAFGIQEMEDIRPRRNEGHRSRKWRDLQQKLLGKRFKCVTRHKMGGLIIAVYARKQAVQAIQGVQVIDVACGVGNVLTNKGAVCVVLRIKDKTIALINSHLAAHQKHVRICI